MAAHLLSTKTRDELLAAAGSPCCKDCGETRAGCNEWVDTNWAVFLCVRCAGRHRSWSRTKSLELDSFSAAEIADLRGKLAARDDEAYDRAAAPRAAPRPAPRRPRTVTPPPSSGASLLRSSTVRSPCVRVVSDASSSDDGASPGGASPGGASPPPRPRPARPRASASHYANQINVCTTSTLQ